MAQPLPELIPFRSGGLWGYADTTGKVVLQPKWREAHFFRNGRAVVRATGKHEFWYCIIDKKGHYIIPPERGWTGGFPDRKMRLNCINEDGLYGWVDSNNNLVLPYQWKSAEAVNTDRYEFNAEGSPIDTEQYLKPTLERKWGPYILFRDVPYGRYGLMDTNRNIKIPAGQVSRIKGDTLFTVRTLQTDSIAEHKVLSCSGRSYEDGPRFPPFGEGPYWLSMSTIIHTRWLLASLTPIDSTTQFVTTWSPRGLPRWNHYGESGNLNPPNHHPVIESDDFRLGEIEEFSKDSFYFSVKKCVANSPCRKVFKSGSPSLWKQEKFWYGCVGRVMGGDCDRLYGALVDKDFNYLVRPLADLQIMGYNPGEDIIAVKAWNNTYGLISSRGDTLMGFSNLELTGGYRWKGRVFAYAITREQFPGFPPGNTREVCRTTDSTGKIAQPWAAWHNVEYLAKSVIISGGSQDMEDYFTAYDSNEKVVVLDSGGQKIVPALCGQYTTLCRVGSHYFWGSYGNWTDGGRLVDSNNVDVFPGCNIHTVTPVAISYGISDRPGPSKQLYTVSGTFNGVEKSELIFYFDVHGVAYTGDVKKK